MKTAAMAAVLTSALALAGAASALPQPVDRVVINIEGKDAKTLHAEFVDAAYKVCHDSDAGVRDAAVGIERQCMRDTVDNAEADLRRITAKLEAAARRPHPNDRE